MRMNLLSNEPEARSGLDNVNAALWACAVVMRPRLLMASAATSLAVLLDGRFFN